MQMRCQRQFWMQKGCDYQSHILYCDVITQPFFIDCYYRQTCTYALSGIHRSYRFPLFYTLFGDFSLLTSCPSLIVCNCQLGIYLKSYMSISSCQRDIWHLCLCSLRRNRITHLDLGRVLYSLYYLLYFQQHCYGQL